MFVAKGETTYDVCDTSSDKGAATIANAGFYTVPGVRQTVCIARQYLRMSVSCTMEYAYSR